MSDDNNDMILCCASCGIAEIDDIKLMPCDDCDLVRYCSDECREVHQSEHEEACKKRAAELREELLFMQPESSYLGDCPICSLPLPLDPEKSRMQSCCSKVICNGCFYANKEREIRGGLVQLCPFCREPSPSSEEDKDKQRMKRIEANDPAAIYHEGGRHLMKGEYNRAFEYFAKAAALGDAGAHYQLSVMYRLGDGVEKDKGKEIHHLEEAAIAGHPSARHNLGTAECDYERTVKHWIIAAAQGHADSMKKLIKVFKVEQGMMFMEKEELAATLRAHKAAVDATKSPQRDKAEEIQRRVSATNKLILL